MASVAAEDAEAGEEDNTKNDHAQQQDEESRVEGKKLPKFAGKRPRHRRRHTRHDGDGHGHGNGHGHGDAKQLDEQLLADYWQLHGRHCYHAQLPVRTTRAPDDTERATVRHW